MMSSSSITSITLGEEGALGLRSTDGGGTLALRSPTSIAHTVSFECGDWLWV